MTREILFHGKRIDNGEWVQGSLLTYSGCGCFICQRVFGMAGVDCSFMEDYRPDCFKRYEVDSATAGQYTGLTDKNGKKIFEGDIVKTKKYGRNIGHSNVNDFDIFTVVYEPCMFRIVNKNRGFNLVDDGYSKFEVIGNIHDNPELLEGIK